MNEYRDEYPEPLWRMDDPDYDASLPQLIVIETIRRELVGDPKKVGLRDRIMRRRPSPTEFDAMWRLIRDARHHGATVEQVIDLLYGTNVIRGAHCIHEAFMTVDGEHGHPGISIDWPFRALPRRLLDWVAKHQVAA